MLTFEKVFLTHVYLWESVPRIVHDGIIVISESKRVDLLSGQLVKIVLLSWGWESTLFPNEVFMWVLGQLKLEAH